MKIKIKSLIKHFIKSLDDYSEGLNKIHEQSNEQFKMKKKIVNAICAVIVIMIILGGYPIGFLLFLHPMNKILRVMIEGEEMLYYQRVIKTVRVAMINISFVIVVVYVIQNYMPILENILNYVVFD